MGSVIAGGMLAGLIHVFAGPDHLAALGPLSVRARGRAWALGLRWGLGHSSGVLVVAGLAFLLRWGLDFEALSAWGERVVGATLVVFGLWGFRSLFRDRLHTHVHLHGGEEHEHFHMHGADGGHSAPEAHAHGHAAFWIGTLHGLAGMSHLLGVLPALALPSGRATTAYLAAFALGTVVAMAAFASLLGAFASRVGLRYYRWSLGAASALCAGTGLAWIILPLAGVDLP